MLKKIIYLDSPISVTNVAKKLGISKGVVSNYFTILKKMRVLKQSKRKYVVNENGFVKGIKIFLNLSCIPLSLFKRHHFIEAVGIYGSCARGENTVDSDIDIWIKIEEGVSEDELALLSSELKKKLKKANPLYLTDKKIEHMKEEDPLFYHSLYFGSIIVYGDKNAL